LQVSITFDGFSSERCGIVAYEWAVGTIPLATDAMTHTIEGIVAHNGVALASLDLTPGTKYYVKVRAETGCGALLESSSDAFTVDLNPPTIPVLTAGQATREWPSFQTDKALVFAQWQASDPQTGVASLEYRVGDRPFSAGYHPRTAVGGDVDVVEGLRMAAGDLPMTLPYIFTLVASSPSGLRSVERISNGVTIDATAPGGGTFSCDAAVRPRDPFACRWEGFADAESAVAGYSIQILGADRSGAGDQILLAPLSLSRDTRTYTYHPLLSSRSPGQHAYVYRASLTVFNRAGLSIVSLSNTIAMDTSPPVAGIVVELTTTWTEGRGQPAQAGADGLRAADVQCQVSQTEVRLAWGGFVDAESGIAQYSVALGSQPGTDDVAGYRSFGTATRGTVTDFLQPLSCGDTVYATVIATNGVGLTVHAMSNGVSIRCEGRQHPAAVYDGLAGPDRQQQSSTLQIEAHWVFEDPCPIVQYEWAIYRADRVLVQDFTVVCARPDPNSKDPRNPDCAEADTVSNFASNDGLTLTAGLAYYVAVRSTNVLGHTRVVRSNGVSVNPTLPLPGVVFDGVIDFVDMSVQATTTLLSCSWTAFGDGDPLRRRPTELIDFFDVSFGTDRTDAQTQADVVAKQRPATGQQHLLVTGLSLVPRSQKYFCTVAATAPNGDVVQSTSNGIFVGYGTPVLSQVVEAPRFQASTSSIQVQFKPFRASVDMMFYQVTNGGGNPN